MSSSPRQHPTEEVRHATTAALCHNHICHGNKDTCGITVVAGVMVNIDDAAVLVTVFIFIIILQVVFEEASYIQRLARN